MRLFVYHLQAVQTELVLMVLLRLAEDIITMDNNVQTTRKKQVTQALHSNMGDLFTFFIETLKVNNARLKELVSKHLGNHCGPQFV